MKISVFGLAFLAALFCSLQLATSASANFNPCEFFRFPFPKYCPPFSFPSFPNFNPGTAWPGNGNENGNGNGGGNATAAGSGNSTAAGSGNATRSLPIPLVGNLPVL